MKFKIGQKVTLVYQMGYCREAIKDCGKVATVVDVTESNVWIHIPTRPRGIQHNGKDFTWCCSSNQIKSLENEQLLFNFMYEK